MVILTSFSWVVCSPGIGGWIAVWMASQSLLQENFAVSSATDRAPRA
jgi:hypothetical protein